MFPCAMRDLLGYCQKREKESTRWTRAWVKRGFKKRPQHLVGYQGIFLKLNMLIPQNFICTDEVLCFLMLIIYKQAYTVIVTFWFLQTFELS